MIEGLHIEPTSKCTLRCPRCPRTEMLKRFGKKSLQLADLDIATFKNFVDVPVDRITMCGNVGDAIYHARLGELISVCKKLSKSIHLTTNGSYRSREWWQDICKELTEDDVVCFSIDGTPEVFTEYRINGDWASIKVGIEECVNSKAQVEWKYIPFNFNEHLITTAKQLSNSLGMDRFVVTPSDRWKINDPLRPSNNDLIGPRDSVQQEYKKQNQRDFILDPKCKNGRHHYISATGYYLPCCYSGDYRFYYKSMWWKDQNKYNIKTTKLSEQIRNFREFYNTIQAEQPEYCIFNCGKNT